MSNSDEEGVFEGLNILSVDERLEILSQIAKDKELKPQDRVAACKEISNLLNDRKQADEGENPTLQISFIKSTKKPHRKSKRKSKNAPKKKKEVSKHWEDELIEGIDKDKEGFSVKEDSKFFTDSPIHSSTQAQLEPKQPQSPPQILDDSLDFLDDDELFKDN